MSTGRKVIFDAESLERTFRRLAHEMIERNRDASEMALLGIRTGGVHLAYRFQKEIKEITGQAVPVGVLDITLYRDDLSDKSHQAVVRGTQIDFNVRGKTVILVDDVLFTGRTIRSAIDQIIDFGRPKCIQLAVLIDRGHRELPIRPDFVGKNVPTSLDEEVVVELKEEGKTDQVFAQARSRS